jgi:uncharacterized membrane protein YphA (DoxX/SURF4 family)
LPLPNIVVGLVAISDIVMLVGGICLVANFKVKLAAIALLAMLILITLSGQL